MLTDAGLDGQVTVDSAGTGGWHVGGPADERALATLRAHGYDDDGHEARQFDRAWFADRDLIVAMDADNLRALRRMGSPEEAEKVVLLRSFDPASPPEDGDVPDPYYGGPDGFDHVLALVETACEGLLDQIRSTLSERD